MRPSTAEYSHLAGAYLALADDPEPVPEQRSPARALCALAAGLVLALAAPLAWVAPGKPRDLPAATASGKAGAVVADGDEAGGDDGPDDGVSQGAQTGAATIA
jgi:hypothetical protein